VTVTIKRLGHLGDGIAEGPVFAALTLPGEEVDGEVLDGRIHAPKIVTPSTDRVKPVCRHYKSCGGCGLQHASDTFVSGWKKGVVTSALAAQNLPAPINAIHTSPANSRVRASFSGRRTKKDALVGFHARASDTIVEIPDCRLLHPDLLNALPALRALTVCGASRKGEIRLTATRSGSGVDVAVFNAREIDGQMQMTLAAIAAEHNLARLTWNSEPIAGIRPPVQSFGAALVNPPPGAFLQATDQGQAMLVDAVQEAVSGARHVIDLFAGCGTFSLPVAAGATVHAVESEAGMLAALDLGWRNAQGLKRVTTETRDLYRRPLLPDEFKKIDAVIIDPPRAGAEQQIIQIAKAKTPAISYVSCNPVTFARDTKILINAGYTLDWIRVVDQFRWSTHVELAAMFTVK
jgi:23S rRNA (uracil1939-C5)-methyltransferase